jgi:hypothetical protein
VIGLAATPSYAQDEVKSGGWTADLEAVRKTYTGEPPIVALEDLYRARVRLPAGELVSDVQLFGPVRIVPYSDRDGAVDASGATFPRGDAALAELLPPGEIAIAVKHHRGSHRSLVLPIRSTISLREELKLHDTHLMMVVGVLRDGIPGAVSLSSPTGYEGGRFGSALYPMVLFRPRYPDYLDTEQRVAFRDNIATAMTGFTALAKLPCSYSGGDPLSAVDLDGVRRQTAMMVRAIAGSEEASEWFRQPPNLLYCGELALLAASAGMLVPLNAANLVPLVGAEVFASFEEQVAAHNRGEPSPFVITEANQHARWIQLRLAPEGLRPAPEYAPAGTYPGEPPLAFRPMGQIDIVEVFLRTLVPREELGEDRGALLQAQLLDAIEKPLLQLLGIEKIPSEDARRQHAQDLWLRFRAVISTPHRDYAEFRQELEPLLAEARSLLLDVSADTAEHLVPPSLFASVAKGVWDGGLLGLDYAGHGLHVSLVRAK